MILWRFLFPSKGINQLPLPAVALQLPDSELALGYFRADWVREVAKSNAGLKEEPVVEHSRPEHRTYDSLLARHGHRRRTIRHDPSSL
jgi:hypothetical protein